MVGFGGLGWLRFGKLVGLGFTSIKTTIWESMFHLFLLKAMNAWRILPISEWLVTLGQSEGPPQPQEVRGLAVTIVDGFGTLVVFFLVFF